MMVVSMLIKLCRNSDSIANEVHGTRHPADSKPNCNEMSDWNKAMLAGHDAVCGKHEGHWKPAHIVVSESQGQGWGI